MSGGDANATLDRIMSGIRKSMATETCRNCRHQYSDEEPGCPDFADRVSGAITAAITGYENSELHLVGGEGAGYVRLIGDLAAALIASGPKR